MPPLRVMVMVRCLRSKPGAPMRAPVIPETVSLRGQQGDQGIPGGQAEPGWASRRRTIVIAEAGFLGPGGSRCLVQMPAESRWASAAMPGPLGCPCGIEVR